MSGIHVPEGYNTVMPYLIVSDAEGLMDFMQQVFGAREKMKVLYDNGYIMHAEVTIGESCIMFSNATDRFSVQNAGLYINVADADATYEKALHAGATSVTPVADQEYGRSGGVKDPWGNVWWITSTP